MSGTSRPRRRAGQRRRVELGPGVEIGGFVVESMIGRGGMSTVYRARQTRLQRPVALKVLLPALAADEQFVQRFRLEGINAARLDHPHIVPVYEAGDDKGHVFLAMKLVEGVTLRDRLGDPDGRVVAAGVVPILAAVAEALDYAHGLGYVHRDVKPGNVLLGFDDHTYLSDFGLTKLLGRDPVITTTGQWVGTADYMAPEQARGATIDHRADLYAFGCVAFECLTGSRPFVADDPLAVMFAHATRDIPSAAERNPALGGAVDVVLARALAKSPDERYQRGADLVDDLRKALAAARPGRCPSCRAGVRPGDGACTRCGATLAWCAQCGRPMVSDDGFCQHCGTRAG